MYMYSNMCKQMANVELPHSNIWNHLTEPKMSSFLFKSVLHKMFLHIVSLIYMYEEDLALNNLQRLPCFIIIILSCHQYGYPWPFLVTSPYRSFLSAGPQDYTAYPHRTDVCRFKLVALLLLGHVKGSIGVHLLWKFTKLFA